MSREMMNALVKTARGEENLHYQKWPKPTAGAGDIVVKIHACGICNSDLHIDNFLIRPPFVLPVQLPLGVTIRRLGSSAAKSALMQVI